MRFAFAVFSLLALAVFPSVGCTTEDPIPPYANVAYHVRCLQSCTGSPDGAPREITRLDGEEGFNIRCQVGTNRNGNRRLSLEARCNGQGPCGDSRYGIMLQGIDPDRDDGRPGDECAVTVYEGGNVYESGCTGGVLDATHRCYVTTEIDTENAEIAGTLRCADISVVGAPELTRHVVTPNGASQDTAQYLAIGCTGL